MSCQCLWRRVAMCLTYHTGSTADNERLLVCLVIIAEGGVEGRLNILVSKCGDYIRNGRTNRQYETDDTQTQ